MSKPTILIADDRPSHLRLMEVMLASEAYDFVTIENSIDVLNYLRHHTPDLIILDIEMPNLSGLDLCGRIRGVTRLMEVPVILVTSLKGPEVATNGQLVKANVILEKPLGLKHFQNTVRLLLPEHGDPPFFSDATTEITFRTRS